MYKACQQTYILKLFIISNKIETMITEIRMYLAERLLGLVLWIVPVEHRDGIKLVRMIRDYANEVLTENNIPHTT